MAIFNVLIQGVLAVYPATCCVLCVCAYFFFLFSEKCEYMLCVLLYARPRVIQRPVPRTASVNKEQTLI